MDINKFSWVIFGLNITIFTFSYVFITNRLEIKNKEVIDKDIETLFAKSNYNKEIYSRYTTFTFITVNAVILIMSTFTTLMLTDNDNLTKSNFMLTLIAFMLSTNTLILVLNDVSAEIQNKKKELMFDKTLIKKENANILDIWKRNKTLKEIIKTSKSIRENATNDEMKNFIEKLQADPKLIQFGNKKKALKFLLLSIEVIKGTNEYTDLFDKVVQYQDEVNTDNIDALIEILVLQKQIRKNQKQITKSIKKLNKFKF